MNDANLAFIVIYVHIKAFIEARLLRLLILHFLTLQ